MVYRIDFQHFLTHMIDYFTMDEVINMQYAIVSAKVANIGRANNVAKINNLYPDPDTVTKYAEYKDKKILEKMYMEMLEEEWVQNIIYKTFVNPLIMHYDIVIICDRIENDYVDVLCKFLKKKFLIEVIDLNSLFINGYVGPIYIDRDEIWDKAVDIRRQATKDEVKAIESTEDGRLKLLRIMTKKQKREKLKELGITVTSADDDNLDQLLIEEWVHNGGD